VSGGGAVPADRFATVEDWLAGACAIAGRDLTLDGWTRYLPAGMSTAAATWWIRECDLSTAHVHRPTSLPNHSCSPPAAEPSRRLLSSLIRDPSHLIH
jgi:hypothetical protein